MEPQRNNLAQEVKRVTAEPARASIRLRAEPAPGGTISIDGSVSLPGPSTKGPLALFIAVTEDKLVSNISAGENQGVTLLHDHVVREWIGPIALQDGDTRFKRAVAVRRTWNAAELGVVAFVQDRLSGQVLQAAGASQCLA